MTLRLGLWLFLLGCSVSFAKDDGSESARMAACRLYLVAKADPLPGAEQYADLRPLVAGVRELRLSLMSSLPMTRATSQIHEGLLKRLNKIVHDLAEVVKKRENHYERDRFFAEASDYLIEMRVSIWQNDLKWLKTDFEDLQRLGDAGLSDLLKAGRLDFVRAGVTYPVANSIAGPVTRVQFAKKMVRRLFAERATAVKLAPELLQKILSHDHTLEGQSVCYQVRSFKFCGGLKGTTLILNEQISLR